MKIVFKYIIVYLIIYVASCVADSVTNSTVGDGSNIVNTHTGNVSINSYYEKTGSFSDPLFKKYNLSSARGFLMLIYDIGLYERDDLWKHMITQEQIFKGKRKYGKDYIKTHYKVWTKGIMSIINEEYDGDMDRADIKFIKGNRNKARIVIKDKKKNEILNIAIRVYNNRIFIAEN